MESIDLEKTRKINLMVKELQKHGFAEHSDSALTMASQVYGQDVPAGPAQQLANFEKRIEQRTDAALRTVANSNSELKSELVKLWETVGRMNKQILNLANSQASTPSSQEVKIVKVAEDDDDSDDSGNDSGGDDSGNDDSDDKAWREVKQERKAPQKPLPEQKAQQGNSTTASRPRFGDFKSEDVSVEKFFYFGNNRK